MTHRVPVEDCISLLQKMSQKTRLRHSVDPNEIIVPYLEQDYNIKLVYDPNELWRPKADPNKAYIIFANEAHYTWLVLKYS